MSLEQQKFEDKDKNLDVPGPAAMKVPFCRLPAMLK
jgi:hypothetical protein